MVSTAIAVPGVLGNDTGGPLTAILDTAPDKGALAVPGLNGDGSFTLELAANAVALWTWLELTETDAVFSDSFFSLCPGTTSTIRIEPRKPMTLAQVEAQLVVKSLVDTYRE